MTLATEHQTQRLAPIAAAAGAIGLGCTLIGTYVDTPHRAIGPQQWGIDLTNRHVGELLALIAFAVVGTVVIFGVVVQRGLRAEPDRTALGSLVVAIFGAVSLIASWSGLPSILAAGATVLALSARSRLGRTPGTARVAVILAAVTMAAAFWIAFTG
jgi:hypothetical protein